MTNLHVRVEVGTMHLHFVHAARAADTSWHLVVHQTENQIHHTHAISTTHKIIYLDQFSKFLFPHRGKTQ